MIRQIKIWPDPVLLGESATIKIFDESVLSLKNDLIETAIKYDGAGLAACQIGIQLQAFVVKVDSEYIFVVNPSSPECTGERSLIIEGCLSFPGITDLVKRYPETKLSYVDELGQPQSLQVKGVPAQCIQHEFEHLSGKTILEALDIYRRDRFIKTFRKVSRKASFSAV